jgi:hypothetical protein
MEYNKNKTDRRINEEIQTKEEHVGNKKTDKKGSRRIKGRQVEKRTTDWK